VLPSDEFLIPQLGSFELLFTAFLTAFFVAGASPITAQTEIKNSASASGGIYQMLFSQMNCTDRWSSHSSISQNRRPCCG
jgi:hypothetical protein